MRGRLTPKQKRLVQELDELSSFLGLDYQRILDYDKEGRAHYLKAMRDTIVRGQVIVWYTLVDECLNMELCHYYFGRKRSFIKLWKTKRFQIFNHHVLEELYTLQKLRHVKAIRKIPKNVAKTIDQLNSLRNGLAHAFFPENLKKSKPQWKGKDIFIIEGLKLLKDDFDEVIEFFFGGGLTNSRLLTSQADGASEP